MVVVGALSLALVFAATLLFARAILHWAGERRWGVSLGVALGLAYGIPAILGPWLSDLRLAVLALFAAAVAGVRLLWRAGGPPAIEAKARLPKLALFGLGVAIFFVGWTAIAGFLFDEANAHNPFTLVIARGIFPPEHPLFPGEPLRYHYAFDLLAAQVRVFTGLPIEWAIDVTTVALFLVLLVVAKDIGEALAGRPGAILAPFLIPLGAGTLAFLLFRDSGWLDLRWSAIPPHFLDIVPPPVISFFFQHPQSVGMPVALAVVLLFADRPAAGTPIWRRRAVGAGLLGLLSLGHIAYFAVLGLALPIFSLTDAIQRRSWRALFRDAAMLLGALIFARLLGGVLAPGPRFESLIDFTHGLFPDPPLLLAWRLFVNYAPGVLAIPFGLYLARVRPNPIRVVALAAAISGFMIPLFVTYKLCWDVVKFFGISAFFSNLLYAEVLTRVFSRRLLVALGLALGLWTSTLWLVRLSALDGRYGIPAMQFLPASPIGVRTAAALEPYLGPRTLVFSTNVDLAQAGGILTPGFDWRQVGEGFILDRDHHDVLLAHKQRARATLDRGALDALGVDLVVLSPTEISELPPVAQAALADEARFQHLLDVRASNGERRVYRIVR